MTCVRVCERQTWLRPTPGSGRDSAADDLPRSDRAERLMWPWWQLHHDAVARSHLAAGQDNTHDARLADEIALGVTVQRGGHQAWLQAVKLRAGIAQPGD